MSEINSLDIQKYWNSLTEAEKFRAFAALAEQASEVENIRYDDERNSIYWDSCGEDIKDE